MDDRIAEVATKDAEGRQWRVEIIEATAINGEHVPKGFVIERCNEELAGDLFYSGKEKVTLLD